MSANEKHPRAPLPDGAAAEAEEVVSQEEIERILKRVDRESAVRDLSGFPKWLVYAIAVGWSLFQVYTAAFGLLPA